MPGPRLRRSGPLWGTQDAPRCPPGDAVGPQRGRAGRQVFRIPDFQVPTHAPPSAPIRRSTAGLRRGGWGSAKLGTWKSAESPFTRTLNRRYNCDFNSRSRKNQCVTLRRDSESYSRYMTG